MKSWKFLQNPWKSPKNYRWNPENIFKKIVENGWKSRNSCCKCLKTGMKWIALMEMQERGARIDGKRRSAGLPLRVPAAPLRLLQTALRPSQFSLFLIFSLYQLFIFLVTFYIGLLPIVILLSIWLSWFHVYYQLFIHSLQLHWFIIDYLNNYSFIHYILHRFITDC